MKLGAHVSIQGGVDTAPDRAKAIGGETFQIFTKSQRQWSAKPLDPKQAHAFREKIVENGFSQACVHASYLINLASPKPDILQKSRAAMIDELLRAATLALPYVIVHSGAHMGEGEKSGLKRLAESIEFVLSRATGAERVKLLLENSAGQGTTLGADLAHLHWIREIFSGEERLGFCLDTCHLYAGGYDFETPSAYAALKAEIDQKVGIDRIYVLHFNDSRKPLGSRLDQHENIGKGKIGETPFSYWVTDPDWNHTIAVLETPGGEQNYQRELNLLKQFRDRAPRSSQSR